MTGTVVDHDDLGVNDWLDDDTEYAWRRQSPYKDRPFPSAARLGYVEGERVAALNIHDLRPRKRRPRRTCQCRGCCHCRGECRTYSRHGMCIGCCRAEAEHESHVPYSGPFRPLYRLPGPDP